MDEKTARLLELWNERKIRFEEKVTDAHQKLFVALSEPLAWERMSFVEKLELAQKTSVEPLLVADFIAAEAKLAELKECRSEFKATFGLA